MTDKRQAVLIDRLKAFGELPDSDIDIGEAALTLAGLAHPGLSLERYRHHIAKLSEEVAERHNDLIDAGADDNLETRLAALKHIIVDKHGYTGDVEHYDNIDNADLVEVIERRKGMPITLSILYISVARKNGWGADGLNIPSHFVARLDMGGQRLIFDPFNNCDILQASDLRKLVKQALGPHAELSADYFEPATSREILIRLENNIKIRQIELEDYQAAVRTVEAMRLIDPEEYRLLLDAGVLYARTDRTLDAIDALEAYIKVAPHDRDRQEAAVLLQQLRLTLN